MSTAVVVDTDGVSYLFKSHPIAHQYLPDLKDRTPMISFMTLAELDRRALDARWGRPAGPGFANTWNSLLYCRTTGICAPSGQR